MQTLTKDEQEQLLLAACVSTASQMVEGVSFGPGMNEALEQADEALPSCEAIEARWPDPKERALACERNLESAIRKATANFLECNHG